MASVYRSILRRPKKGKLAPIFKLDFVCFSKIFDRLSLDDLHAFGLTCKKFQQTAGEYFQQTYKSTEIRGAFDGIYTCSDISYSGELNGFRRYITRLSLYGNRVVNDEIDIFDCIRTNCIHTKSLRHIQFVDVAITKKSVKSIRKLLRKVEILEIDTCTIDGKLYQNFLKYCTQLKHLHVRRFGGNIKWLNKNYPELEHLELYQIGSKIDELKVFFARNKSVHSLSIDANCLWQNESSIMSANIVLDDLIVDINGWELRIESMYNLLYRLYERKFYKRLHLYAAYIDEQITEQIASIHGLEKLFITSHIAYGIPLPNLSNLKELSFRWCPEFFEIETIAEKLANLERVYFEQATLSEVLLFVRKLAKLKKIYVDHFKNAQDFDFTFDLRTLNKQRNQLRNANILCIYVEETIYLNTKWMTNEVTLNKIDLQRNDSYKWNHHFEYNHRIC